MKIKPLAFGLGAQVSGIDLREPVDAGVVDGVRAAWLEHLVLVFPEQDINLAQHIAFSAQLGELEVHPAKHYQHPTYPEIFEVTNRLVDGQRSVSAEVGRSWHSDGAFTLRPPTGSLLHCRELPPVGGDTWFANMYMAYDALSAGMKRLIEGLHVVNDLGLSYERQARAAHIVKDHLNDNRPVVQPMVRVHPETGRKALYLNETVTRRIHELTHSESEGMLDFLFAHSVRPEFTFRHRWSRHDLVLWDNRCAMHMAPADYDPKQVRQMYRTTLRGEPLGFAVEAQAAR